MSDAEKVKSEPKAEKFTPGPWEIHRYVNYCGFSIHAPNVGCIAERWWNSEELDIPIDANARLIAAAPELYTAAVLACLNFERKSQSNSWSDWIGDDDHEAWTALEKALAKARGEA